MIEAARLYDSAPSKGFSIGLLDDSMEEEGGHTYRLPGGPCTQRDCLVVRYLVQKTFKTISSFSSKSTASNVKYSGYQFFFFFTKKPQVFEVFATGLHFMQG